MILRKGAYYALTEECVELDRLCDEDIDTILEHRSQLARPDLISGGRSLFAKASFAGGTEDQIDFTSEDFWAKLLPHWQSDLKSRSHQKRDAKGSTKKQKEGWDRALVTGVFEWIFEFGCKGLTSRCPELAVVPRVILFYALLPLYRDKVKEDSPLEAYVSYSMDEIEPRQEMEDAQKSRPFTDRSSLMACFEGGIWSC
jgi:hypothetical protein